MYEQSGNVPKRIIHEDAGVGIFVGALVEMKSKSATTSAKGKRHRSRKNRTIIVKQTGRELESQFQKETDELTADELRIIGVGDVNELHWVCCGCKKPKEHTSGCKFDPKLKPSLTVGGKQTSLDGFLGVSTSSSNAAIQEVVEEGISGNQKMQSETALPEEASLLGEDSISNKISKYANVFFHFWIKPKICNAETGRVDPSVMSHNKITSWSFPFPSPFGTKAILQFTLSSKEKLDYSLKNEALALDGMVLVVVDYETFFPQDSLNLKCSCGKKLIRNGWTPYCRIERSLQLGRVLQAVDYLCENCLQPQPGKKTSYFNSLSEHIICQLPPALRSKLDFVVGGQGYIINRQVLPMLQEMTAGGLSFDQIEKVSKVAICTEFARRDLSRLKLIESQVASGSVCPQRVLDKEPLTSWTAPFILTAKIACDAYCEESRRTEPYRQASFARAAIGENVLQNDGCYPYGNGASDTGVVSLQHILNMKGELVAGFGTLTKSTDEYTDAYSKIARYKSEHNDSKPIKVVWTDNPKGDESVVMKVFGEGCRVRKDVFHILAKLLKIARQGHPLRPSFSAKISSCFFEHLQEDLDKEAARLKVEGKSDEEIKKLLRSPFYTKKASLRTIVREGKDISEDLKLVVAQFIGIGLFVGNGLEIVDEVYGTLSTYVGEVLDPEVVIWDNIGTEEEPKWLVRRGTNMCENFHRFVKQLKLYRFSSEVGNHIYIFSMWLFSQRSRCRRQRLDLLAHVHDPILMNDLVSLQERVRPYISYDPCLTGHVRLEPMKASEYFSGIVLHNSASAIAKAVSKFNEECEEYETEEPEPYHARHRHFPDWLAKPESHARAFSSKPEDLEFKLLRAYITKSERFLNSKAKKLVREQSWDALYGAFASGNVRTYVLVDELAEHWMNQILEAFWEEKDIKEDELVVPRAAVKPKTPQQIVDGVLDIGHRIHVALSRNNDPKLMPQASVSTRTIASSSVNIVEPSVTAVTFGPLLPAPSVTIPAVDARRLNERSAATRKRTKTTRISNASSAAGSHSVQEVSEKGGKRAPRQKCPECDAKRHKLDSDCGYFIFAEEQKKLPIDDPRHIKRRTGETENDCLRRAYIQGKSVAQNQS